MILFSFPFHIDLLSVVLAIATAVGGWLGSRIITPSDHDRAVLLEKIAAASAALVVSLYPTADWAKLLELVVKAIAGSAGVPTTNTAAIERAAAAALTQLGRNPGVK